MTQVSLYDRPELYDLVMQPNPAAEALYLQEAQRRGGAVLDLACGSGRFSIPLARAGIDVVGGDLSPAMLHRAREVARGADVTIDFIELDMRDFDLSPRQFGVILIAANSLLHLHDADDFRRCFTSVARHLAPGGVLAFDAFVPSPRILARDPRQRHKVGEFLHQELGRLTLEETTDYDAADQINRGTWFWSSDDRRDVLVMPLHLRQIYPQELPLLLELGGLRLAARYGTFDRGAFDRHSARQICLCEAG